MARSMQGGTRGFLRGKVANDLYQVSHRADGRKVQIVRAVEESRINNNTLEQALARMRMALLMGALSDLKQIVDHSWQGIPYGQLSIAHFVRINMPAVISDCKDNWTADNQFCYPVKGVSAMRVGAFKISSGTLSEPSCIVRGSHYISGRWFPFEIKTGCQHPTFRDLRSALGLNANDYITLLMATGLDLGSRGIVNQGFSFVRLYLSQSMSDDVSLSNYNLSEVFTYEGNTPYRLSLDATSGTILIEVDVAADGIARDAIASAVIVSYWNGSVWARNNAQFSPVSGASGFNFEYNSPRLVFQSWFESYDPEAEGSEDYPGKL